MTLSPADVAAIHQLLARYGHLVDARDWEGLRSIFAEDGVFDATVYGMPAARGAPAIIEFFAAARHPAAHHCTNIEIWPEEDGAAVRSKWLVGYPDGSTGGGDYEDRVARRGTEWVFANRTVIRRWPETSAPTIQMDATTESGR